MAVTYYCSTCDHNQVTHGDPSTGKFFAVHGYAAKVIRNGRDKPIWRTDDFVPVVFALCNECLAYHPPHERMFELDNRVVIE